MAKSGYSITTGGTVGLTATVARSVLGIKAGSSFGVDLTKFRISFDGTNPTAAMVLVEVCAATFATNAPGTQSTSVNVVQAYGRVAGAGFAGAKAWNASNEPTVLTVIEEHLVSPYAGSLPYDCPLGVSPDSPLDQGFALRVTAPANVNCRASLWFERC